MKSLSHTAAAVVTLCTHVVFAQSVFAQTPPQLSAEVSEPEVEVGEAFSVQLKAMSETGETVSNPQLRPPSGFSISSPMISTQTFMQFGTGGRRTTSGIGATWSLVASTPGVFTISAPTIEWNGKKLSSNPLSVKVLPQGTKPKKQGGFLFPGGGPGSMFGPNWPFPGFEETDDESAAEPSLTLAQAPSNDVFLHATVDKTRAVVGEQITLSIYRYTQPRAFISNPSPTPMTLQDFVRYSLASDAGAQNALRAKAGGKLFSARLIDKYAIIPLRAGRLKTGPYVETYIANNRRTTFKRESEDLTLIVSEPPIENRPVGYRLGDVGQFQLSALVQPRKITEGGSVAALIKVTGYGNFPASLNLPGKTGIDWLDPEKKEQIEAKNGDIVGFRSFGYVVRLAPKGTVDLGTIELPYWNPRAKRYEVARTNLGTVEVTPSANAPATPGTPKEPPPSAEEGPFAKLPTPRTALSAFSRPVERVWLPGFRFPVALVVPPLLALGFLFGRETVKRTKERLAERKQSPKTLAKAALSIAKEQSTSDVKSAISGVERAVFLAIEGTSGAKARGILRDELAKELIEKGVPEDLAIRIEELLANCDVLRFDPRLASAMGEQRGPDKEGGAGTSTGQTNIQSLLRDADNLVNDLFRTKAA